MVEGFKGDGVNLGRSGESWGRWWYRRDQVGDTLNKKLLEMMRNFLFMEGEEVLEERFLGEGGGLLALKEV